MTMPISTKKTDGGRIKGAAAVPSVVEIRVQTQLPNNKLQSYKFYGSFTTAPSNFQTLANALFTSIGSAWSTNLAALMVPATIYQSVFVRDMTNVFNAVFQGTGTAIPGTSASIAMPMGTAAVMTVNVAQRGKGAKGRIFLGGFATNADAAGGLITAAAQTSINAYGTAIFNAITAQSLTPCLPQPARAQYTGVTGTIHPARLATKVNVLNYVLRDLIWDAQRRRAQAG